jgi:hypothetical protein
VRGRAGALGSEAVSTLGAPAEIPTPPLTIDLNITAHCILTPGYHIEFENLIPKSRLKLLLGSCLFCSSVRFSHLLNVLASRLGKGRWKLL